MQSHAETVQAYLAELPDDRRAAIQAVRQIILDSLAPGYEERMQYGMIGYCVPHSIYPAGYHCDPKQPLPFAGLASQKGHMSLYLTCLYYDAEARERFERQWKASGAKKLDAGKACIRFKRVEDLALGLIAESIRSMPVAVFVAKYEAARSALSSAKHTTKKTTTKAAQSAAKKTGARQTGPKAKPR